MNGTSGPWGLSGAGSFSPSNEGFTPNGGIASATGLTLVFTSPAPVDARLAQLNPKLNGYDRKFVLPTGGETPKRVARGDFKKFDVHPDAAADPKGMQPGEWRAGHKRVGRNGLFRIAGLVALVDALGLRCSETDVACAQIDLKHAEITVTGKTGPRTLPLSGRMVRVLRWLRRRRRSFASQGPQRFAILPRVGDVIVRPDVARPEVHLELGHGQVGQFRGLAKG